MRQSLRFASHPGKVVKLVETNPQKSVEKQNEGNVSQARALLSKDNDEDDHDAFIIN